MSDDVTTYGMAIPMSFDDISPTEREKLISETTGQKNWESPENPYYEVEDEKIQVKVDTDSRIYVVYQKSLSLYDDAYPSIAFMQEDVEKFKEKIPEKLMEHTSAKPFGFCIRWYNGTDMTALSDCKCFNW